MRICQSRVHPLLTWRDKKKLSFMQIKNAIACFGFHFLPLISPLPLSLISLSVPTTPTRLDRMSPDPTTQTHHCGFPQTVRVTKRSIPMRESCTPGTSMSTRRRSPKRSSGRTVGSTLSRTSSTSFLKITGFTLSLLICVMEFKLF
jgi:hypothetical protein